MRHVDIILEIIRLCKEGRKTSEINATKVQDLIGRGNSGLAKLYESKSDLLQEEVETIIDNFSSQIEWAGYSVVHNYNVFGYVGRAIVPKGHMPYDNVLAYIEEGKDVADYKAKYLEVAEKYMALLEKPNSGQATEGSRKVAEAISVAEKAVRVTIEREKNALSSELQIAMDKILDLLRAGK